MSDSITITTDQVKALESDGHFVVKGERPACPADTDGDGDCVACFKYPDVHGRLNPPAVWVAAAQPCTTCDGTGRMHCPGPFTDARRKLTQMQRDAAGLVCGIDYCYGMHMGHECVTCYGTGRRVVELRVECGCGPKCRLSRSLGYYTISLSDDNDGDYLVACTRVEP